MIGRPGLLEALVPVVLAGDEDRQAVDEADAGGKRLLDVPLGRLLGADRQVADEDVGLGVLEDPDDVGGLARGLGDLLLQVLAEAVVGHAAVDLDPELRDVGELIRVVLAGEDRLGEVLADLVGVDVEGGGELDVADVVAAEVHVHEARDLLGGIGVLVVLDALHERARAVADADDRDADLLVASAVAAGAVRSSIHGAHAWEILLDSEDSALKPHLRCRGGYTSSAGTAGSTGAAAPPRRARRARSARARRAGPR